MEILTVLEEAMTEQLDFITLYKSIAAFLDTCYYQFGDFDNNFIHIEKIKRNFELLLIRNGCDIVRLKSKAEIIFNHFKNFASTKSSSKI